VQPCIIENCIIKIESFQKRIWPVVQTCVSLWLLNLCNDQYAYAKVCVIQTVFFYASVVLQPVCIKKRHIIAELTVFHNFISLECFNP